MAVIQPALFTQWLGGGGVRDNITYYYGVREWLLITGGGRLQNKIGEWGQVNYYPNNVLAILKGRHERF